MSDMLEQTHTLSPLSESIQMYLVTIARLAVDDKPVPLSQLGAELSVSAVSANEMCRKLQDRGLVIYRPYKGVTLTPEGLTRANYVLCRHRLWEVFLVDVLGFDYEQAHDAACRLEHTTPDLVANRLDRYLGFPQTNPLGEPIPRMRESITGQTPLTLSMVGLGQTVYVARIDAPKQTKRFLEQQGLSTGKAISIIAISDSAVLLETNNRQLSLLRDVAEKVAVTR